MTELTQWQKYVGQPIMMEKLNEDFIDFIRLLESKDVRYLIVGGYAVGLHGFPRYTGDIDFFVAINEKNAVLLESVFNDFGFGELDISKDDFLKSDFVVEIGREPRKIQVLTNIDGVKFDECYDRRFEVKYSGIAMKFIGKNDLIENKKTSKRPKDLIDLVVSTKQSITYNIFVFIVGPPRLD